MSFPLTVPPLPSFSMITRLMCRPSPTLSTSSVLCALPSWVLDFPPGFTPCFGERPLAVPFLLFSVPSSVSTVGSRPCCRLLPVFLFGSMRTLSEPPVLPCLSVEGVSLPTLPVRAAFELSPSPEVDPTAGFVDSPPRVVQGLVAGPEPSKDRLLRFPGQKHFFTWASGTYRRV